MLSQINAAISTVMFINEDTSTFCLKATT